MDILTSGIIIVSIIIGLLILFNIRMSKVMNYRFTILDKIEQLAYKDIDNDLQFSWRYTAFLEDVSIKKMILMFWKPLSSFYVGKDYLK